MNKGTLLAAGWVWTTLGEICLSPQYGWTTSAFDKGKLRLLRTSDITSGLIDWSSVPYCQREPIETNKYLLKDGDIVISRAGSVGYSLLIKKPEKTVFASYLIRFRPLINAQFVAYFLKSPLYWKSISEKKLGIAVPNVNATKLKQIKFPLAPTPEQHHIVVKIEELFTKLNAGVEALKKIKIQLKRYRQAVIKHAFEGKLTANWREKNCILTSGENSASKLFAKIKTEKSRSIRDKKLLPITDNEKLFDLPKEWMWCRLHEVTQATQGTQIPKKEQIRKEKNGFIRYLYISDFLNDDKKIYVRNAYPHKVVNNKNLIMVNTGATAGTVFKGKYGVLSNNLFFISFPDRYIERDYLYHFLSSDYFQGKAKLKGAANPHMGHEKYGRSIFPLAPLDEQRQIIDEITQRFSVTDETDKIIEVSLKHAERLRRSIFKRAFKGKLVSQNPNDEPAEKLLERIKAEKAKYDKEKLVKKTWKRKTKQKKLL